MAPRRTLLLALVALLLAVPALVLGSALRPAVEDRSAASPGGGQAGGSEGIGPLGGLLVAQRPTVRLGADTVVQSGQLTLSARGFAPGEPLVVEAVLAEEGKQVELHRPTAGADGSLEELAVSVPEAVTSGQRTIRVTGQQSGQVGEATVYVRAARPWLVLGAETLRPTDRLGFVAGGFEPHEQVRVAFGQPEAPATFELSADRAGNTVWTETPLPSVQAGAYQLVLIGAQSGVRLDRTVQVEPLKPVLELSPWYGPPGGHLELNGQGFLPRETVSVAYDEAQVGEFEADEYGNTWGLRVPDIPYDATHTLVVTLKGATSGAAASAEFKVADPHPWAELSTYAGPPGAAVYVSGGGWAARERVTLHLGEDASPAVGSGTTDEYGYLRFAGPAPIPPSADGIVQIVAVGERSGAQTSAKFTVVRPYIPGAVPGGQPQSPRPTLPVPTPVPTVSPR
ncbi:MAG: hypothetical protein HY690_01610 [Chloroflexi bacterium]|nr:hypothetical protein [Chloroflexota bacterium]